MIQQSNFRFLSLILCVCSIFTLVSCDKEVDNVVENIEIPQQEHNFTESEEDVYAKTELKGTYLSAYDDVDCYDTNKFIASAIYYVTKDQNDVIPVIPGYTENEEVMLRLMGVTKDMLSYYAISVSLDPNSLFTFALLRPKDGYADEMVEAMSHRLIDLQVLALKDEKAKALLDTYVFEPIGDFVMMLICENVEEVYPTFHKAMEDADLSSLLNIEGDSILDE